MYPQLFFIRRIAFILLRVDIFITQHIIVRIINFTEIDNSVLAVHRNNLVIVASLNLLATTAEVLLSKWRFIAYIDSILVLLIVVAHRLHLQAVAYVVGVLVEAHLPVVSSFLTFTLCSAATYLVRNLLYFLYLHLKLFRLFIVLIFYRHLLLLLKRYQLVTYYHKLVDDGLQELALVVVFHFQGFLFLLLEDVDLFSEDWVEAIRSNGLDLHVSWYHLLSTLSELAREVDFLATGFVESVCLIVSERLAKAT